MFPGRWLVNMISKVIFTACMVGVAVSEHPNDYIVDYYAYPHYEFEYSIHDPHTGDIKSAHETREGDTVKGFYTLKEADGTTREVYYTADKHNGFNAIVKRTGQAVHPIHHGGYTQRSSEHNYP